MSIPCHTCDEVLDDDATFCGMCGAIRSQIAATPIAATLAAQLNLLMTGFPPEPGLTLRTEEGEEDTFLADIPSRPK